MKPLLTICIPTITKRKRQLNRLLSILQNQILRDNLQDKIEILVHMDRMETSIGAKGNNMILRARAPYVVGIGDDDVVSDNYCKLICDTIEKNSDVDQITFGVKQYNKFLKSFQARFSKENKNLVLDFRFFKMIFKTFGDLKNQTHEDYDLYVFGKKICHIKRKSFLSYMSLFFILPFIWNLKQVNGYTWGIMVIKKEIAEKVKFSDAPRCADKEFVMGLRDLDLIKTEVVLDETLYFYHYNPKYSLNRDLQRKKFNRIKSPKINHKFVPITLENIIWI